MPGERERKFTEDFIQKWAKTSEKKEEVEEVFECPLCDTMVPADADVCPNCGAEFAEDESEEIIEQFECPLCGTMVDSDATSCPSCSAEFVDEVEEEGTPEPVTAPAGVAAATATDDLLDELADILGLEETVPEKKPAAPAPPKRPAPPFKAKAPPARRPPPAPPRRTPPVPAKAPPKPKIPEPPKKAPPKREPAKAPPARRERTPARAPPAAKRGLSLKTGLTNGSGLGKRRGLTNGLAKGKGLTNGLGRTNGLTNGLGRTNGLTNGLGRTNGLTNGLGRTNGLTNGLGRTNGLTNGLGRTNGLTNGLGRTNGLTNGLGRTNGLTNGLGRTNGLTNGLGRTNGLTNGLGRTNGITNGLGRTNGITNGLSRLRTGLTNGNGLTNGLGSRRAILRGRDRAKFLIIPLVAVALLSVSMLAGLTHVPTAEEAVFVIDGDMDEWDNVTAHASDPSVLPMNQNVDIIETKMAVEGSRFLFYVQVRGNILQGQSPYGDAGDTVQVFIDTDDDPDTGFPVGSIGADALVNVAGIAGSVKGSKAYLYHEGAGNDYDGWLDTGPVTAIANGTDMEMSVLGLYIGLEPDDNYAAVFRASSWDSSHDLSDYPISTAGGAIEITQQGITNGLLSAANTNIMKITATGKHGNVTLTGLTLTRSGTAQVSSVTVTGTGIAASAGFVGDRASLVLPEIVLAPGESIEMYVSVPLDQADQGKSVGVSIEEPGHVIVSGGVVSLKTVSPAPGYSDMAYVLDVPSNITIDGAFDDWDGKPATTEPNEIASATPQAAGIDISRYAVNRSGDKLSMMMEVSGNVLGGTGVTFIDIPIFKPPPAPSSGSTGPSTPSNPDSDGDGTPDSLEPGYEHDFDNDGLQDSVDPDDDGDGLMDTMDYWKGGIYLGDVDLPIQPGNDTARMYIDVNSTTGTGYPVQGLGADYMLYVTGDDGKVLDSALYAFNYSGWERIASVEAACDYHMLETQAGLDALGHPNNVSVAFHMENWNGKVEDLSGPGNMTFTRAADPLASVMSPGLDSRGGQKAVEKEPGTRGNLDELNSGTGQTAGDRFGWNVSAAGDLNNDGYDDVVVGAPKGNGIYDNIVRDTGASSSSVPFNTAYNAYRVQALFEQSVIAQAGTISKIYLEKSTGNTGTFENLTIKICHTSLVPTTLSGTWVTNYDGNTPVEVFNGTVTAPASTGWWEFDVQDLFTYDNSDNLLLDISWNGSSGSSCNVYTTDFGAGNYHRVYRNDYNGETTGTRNSYGYNLRLGVIPSDAEASTRDNGTAYVYFGWPGFNVSDIDAGNANVTIFGNASDGHLGWDVASLGNVNGDAYDDIIIGQPDDGPGYAHVFYGKATSSWASSYSSDDADVTISGEAANDRFGAAVSGAGDYDNANNDDIIVGAHDADGGNGSAYIFYGDGSIPTSAGSADVVLRGRYSNSEFGFSVSDAGNADATGGDEVVVGTPGKDRAYVFYSPEEKNATEEQSVYGTVSPATNGYQNTQSSNDGYETITEELVPGSAVIWSDDFETDKGWTGYGGTGEWERDVPGGLGGSSGRADPTADHSPDGTYCIGNDLTGLGTNLGDYEDTSSTIYWLTSPAIDLTGYTYIHLRFWRWLNVERSNAFTYDTAYIEVQNSVSGWQRVWDNDDMYCVDGKWSQVIYNVSTYADNQASFQVRFGIEGDNAVYLSGWNIDDLELVTGSMVTYDYSSGYDTDKWSFYKASELSNPPGSGPDITSETSFNLGTITASDNSRAQLTITNLYYGLFHFNITINEDPADIASLHIEWEGYGSQYVCNLYVWNFGTSSWEAISTNNLNAADTAMPDSITSGISNYIQNGFMLSLHGLRQGDQLRRGPAHNQRPGAQVEPHS